MMTANARSIADRIERGYLGILLSGSAEQAGEVIRVGRDLVKR
jgi:hypothetical protein